MGTRRHLVQFLRTSNLHSITSTNICHQKIRTSGTGTAGTKQLRSTNIAVSTTNNDIRHGSSTAGDDRSGSRRHKEPTLNRRGDATHMPENQENSSYASSQSRYMAHL